LCQVHDPTVLRREKALTDSAWKTSQLCRQYSYSGKAPGKF
jgi:hypothetical protein